MPDPRIEKVFNTVWRQLPSYQAVLSLRGILELRKIVYPEINTYEQEFSDYAKLLQSFGISLTYYNSGFYEAIPSRTVPDDFDFYIPKSMVGLEGYAVTTSTMLLILAGVLLSYKLLDTAKDWLTGKAREEERKYTHWLTTLDTSTRQEIVSREEHIRADQASMSLWNKIKSTTGDVLNIGGLLAIGAIAALFIPLLKGSD